MRLGGAKIAQFHHTMIKFVVEPFQTDDCNGCPRSCITRAEYKTDFSLQARPTAGYNFSPNLTNFGNSSNEREFFLLNSVKKREERNYHITLSDDWNAARFLVKETTCG